MQARLKLKDPGFEYRLVRRRIYTACVLLLILAGVLLARISYLQVVLHAHFTTLSKNNRVKVIPIPPIRGLIFSRDGVLLADNRPSFSLVLVPEDVKNLHRAITRSRRSAASKAFHCDLT
jgi:penicillin-binding protein 2